MPTIHSEYQSQNIEFNDTIKWKNWTFNVGAAAQQGHALRPGPAGGLVDAVRLRLGAREQVQDVRDPVQQDDPAARSAPPGPTTARTRSTRATPSTTRRPARCRAPRRGTATGRDLIDALLRRRTACSSRPTPVASSSGKLFVDGHDAAHDRRVPGRHGAGSSAPRWTGRVYGRYRKAEPLLGGHQQQRARASQPAGGHSRASSTSRTSPTQLAQIGSGSTYVIAELDGAYTKYYEVTARGRVARRARPSSAARTPGATTTATSTRTTPTTANDANIFIGSSNIADGAGRQLWDFKDGDLRGDRPHLLKVYGYCSLRLERDASAPTSSPSRASRGRRGATSRTARSRRAPATPTATPSRPARAAPTRTTSSTSTTRRTSASEAALQPPARRPTCSTSSTSRPATTIQPASTTSTFGTPRTYFDPRRLQVAVRFQF